MLKATYSSPVSSPWKVTSCVENLVLQELQFQKVGVCPTSQVGQAWAISDLMRASWRVNLMVVLKRLFLKRG